jgi:putative FmdB family regulatory protein
MPIYEFYCSSCHTLFSFLSRGVNTTKRPGCPRCKRHRLSRRVSAFAISSGRNDSDEAGGQPDDEAMERVLGALTQEADGLDEENPRAMAGLMRKLYDGMGLRLGVGMEEAMRRMEAGEDPDQIEQDLGDLLEGEEPLIVGGSLRGLSRRLRPPAVDGTLHEM